MKSARWAALYPPPKRTRASKAADPLLRVERRLDAAAGNTLADDVRLGLTAARKWLPPKYFYDDRGSRLFAAICELPEYYPTRTEHALLSDIADAVVGATRPAQLVELGSGASRKTRLLLDALTRVQPSATYVPIDVSESTLRQSAAALRIAYPALRVHAIVADYDRGVPALAPSTPRLIAFLGSTIGNFVPPDDVVFLRRLARQLQAGDSLLIGVDLVKPAGLLHAAYNDSAGVTAEFNLNVLRVINRGLDANFDPALFEHQAFYNAEQAQIEMHLCARQAHSVHIAALDLTVAFSAGETIHTETSRKFTRATAIAMLEAAGFRLERWYTPPDEAFALALATVEAPT